jgi:hypothetical protein
MAYGARSRRMIRTACEARWRLPSKADRQAQSRDARRAAHATRTHRLPPTEPKRGKLQYGAGRPPLEQRMPSMRPEQYSRRPLRLGSPSRREAAPAQPRRTISPKRSYLTTPRQGSVESNNSVGPTYFGCDRYGACVPFNKEHASIKGSCLSCAHAARHGILGHLCL